jgi:tetratricopeptide (TPR) repeat protein
MPRPVAVALLAVAVAVFAIAAPQARQDLLGKIDFPTSQTGPAQDAFVRGVLLLHSFEYDDAKEAFQQAQKAAPDFAMAYWGEAMTYNHPLWSQTAPDPAREALGKLAATREQRLAKAGNDKERDWLRAVEALYGEGEKPARDLAYAAEMRRMNDKYPDDLEIKAFYALALLGSSQGRDVGTYMKAAALVEDVVRVNPQHPGAIHYLIHAYDDPAHAPLGLRYAEAYAKIAPAASHALHMPSHIYFALGMWDKAADLNERSAKAADERVSRKGLGVDDRGFHALLWLTYSYLQQGRYQDARDVLDQIDKAAAESGSVRTRSHLALARAAWVIETRRWTDAKPDGVNPEGLGADATAADLFAIGMAAFRSGNRAAGSDALQRMATLAGDGDRPVRSVTTAKPSTTRPNTSRPGVTPMPVPRPSLPTPAELIAAQTAAAGQPQTGLPAAGSGNDKRVAAIMAQQLEAILIFSEGRRDEGLVLARQAAAVEDDLSFEFGPPLPVKPGHELVGDLSMDVRRPGDAVVAYEAALKRYPGRALSLLGLYRAAMASRQPQKAQQAAADLRKIWQRADKTLPELREIAAVPPPSSH